MTANIEEAVADVVSGILGHPVAVSANREQDGLWDSLRHIQIMFAVEERFGITLSEQEMSSCDSVRKIAQAVQAHHAA